MITALGSAEESLKIFRYIQRAICERIGCLNYLAIIVPLWNDAPERTFKEVHAVFDRAIARFTRTENLRQLRHGRRAY